MNGNIRIEGGKLRLPKIGFVRICLHREAQPDWKLKSVTVTEESDGKYFASLLYEFEDHENQGSVEKGAEAKILGIDFAMRGLAVMSDGSRADYPGYYRKAEKRLAREQRKLSHCQKGSKNREKQRKRVAKCSGKEASSDKKKEDAVTKHIKKLVYTRAFC